MRILVIRLKRIKSKWLNYIIADNNCLSMAKCENPIIAALFDTNHGYIWIKYKHPNIGAILVKYEKKVTIQYLGNI